MAGSIPLTRPTNARMTVATTTIVGIDDEPDVGRFGILGNGAVEGRSSDADRHRISEQDSGNAADEGDGQRFGQELEEDVALAAAERLFHADFARALRHRHQHDVHQADAADAERQRADEAQQNLAGRW